MVGNIVDAVHNASLRFLIVDDHPLFREALNFAIGAAYPDAETYESADLEEAIEILKNHSPFDLALLDLAIPGTSGFDGIIKLRTLYPRLPVVIVSGHEDARTVKTALSFGISGFIPKSTRKDELTAAITTVITGDIFLPGGLNDETIEGQDQTSSDSTALELASFTPQQLRVLGMLRDGLLNKQIAYELGVSETTIKAHVSKILRKLDVNNRTQAVMKIEKFNLQNTTEI